MKSEFICYHNKILNKGVLSLLLLFLSKSFGLLNPLFFSSIFAIWVLLFDSPQIKASPDKPTVINSTYSNFSSDFIPGKALTAKQAKCLRQNKWQLINIRDSVKHKTIRLMEIKPADNATKCQMQTIRQHLPHPPEGQFNLNKACIITRYNSNPLRRIMSFVEIYEPEELLGFEYQDSNFRRNLDWPEQYEIYEPANHQLQGYYRFINQIHKELVLRPTPFDTKA